MSPRVRKNRRAPEVRRLIEKDCADWLDRPIRSIDSGDVYDVVEAVVQRGSPVMANRLLAYLGPVFKWASMPQRGRKPYIDSNPVLAVINPHQEEARTRTLSDDELIEVWHAADAMGYPYGRLIQIAILTGQRRGEIAQMAWTDLPADLRAVDDDGEPVQLDDPTWKLSAEITKNKRDHDVQLSDQVLAILRDVPQHTGPLVFTTRNGNTAIAGWSKFKAALDRKVHEGRVKAAEGRGDDPENVEPMPAWTVHDIRRTVSTRLAELGIAQQVTERILNHQTGVISGVAAVYNRYSFAKERREALQAWANRVDQLLGKSKNNVVQFKELA